MNSHNEIVIKFLFLVLVCVLVWGDVEARCIEREREALVSFKNGLIDEHGILSSWRRSDECCKWYGVVCSNTTGHVTRLELGAGDFDGVLGGKLSSSLLELHHLTYLNLSHNDFGGDRIPQFIGSMKQLQYLYLWSSNFSGIVPPQLGNLTNLRTLNLSHNSLTSENLDWISGLSSLSVLDLSYSFDLNDTNGVEQILALHSLQELHLRSCNINDVNPLIVNSSSSTSLSILDLHDNHLTSSAFDWLFNVSMNIVHIDLSKNALGRPIPNSFERLAHLEYLDLSSSMLIGEIPTSLCNLSHLQELVLYENGLIGSLDELLGNLSANGFSSSLQILDLARNQFHGSIPDLRGFSALTQVYLSFNNFTGFVPLSLGQLSKLQNLDVANNHLKGVVSESHLTKLDSLKVLDLSFNSLTLRIAPDWNPPFQLDLLFLAGCSVGPSFPNWIQTQRNLLMLDLSSAGIIDEVPVGLWGLSPVLGVLLSDNQFSGTIPDLSANAIECIDFSSNKFSGLIPSFHPSTVIIQLSQNMLFGSLSSFCQTPHDQLVFLELSDNRLSGELPDCWEKNLPNLQDVHLDNNSFSGRIPHSLGSLANLYSLRLSDNNLSGELPSTLRFCPELRFMDVRGNKLTGEIPAWIGEIYQLQFLNLRSNKLDGGVPPAICNLTAIRILDISRNKLSGRIPDCFNNTFALMQTAAETRHVVGVILSILLDPQLPNRKIFKHYSDYSSVQWKGRKSEALDLLKLIDFSSNRFIGNIPQSFSRMRGLISLNLSRNRLTGKIIPDIGQMGRLESLDLSHNQLSGAIPTSLAQLHFLSVLDLSSNNLSGKIPSSTQLQSFNTSSYARNNGLCGEPLALCPEDRLRPPPTTTTYREKDDGIWRLSFMQGLIISIVFGFILGFWGVVGSFVIKKTWRNAFFNLLDAAGDWFYVRIAIFLSKWRRT